MTSFHRGFSEAEQTEIRLQWFVLRSTARRMAWTAGIVAALIGFAAGAAWSQDRMHMEGPAGACFAVVVIENRRGVYNADEALDTAQGRVVLRYTTVGGHNPTDDDQVEVVSLPDGVTADPMAMALPDGETGRVCLLEWIGG